MWQPNPYAIVLMIGMIPLLALAAAAWHYRSNRAAQLFLAYTIAAAGLMLLYALELFSARLSLIMSWAKLEYPLSLSLPVVWLLLIAAYCGYEEWITWRRVLLLFIIPALHVLLVWTNEYHGLNWQTVGTDTVNGLVLFSRTYGPALYIGTAYLYLIATVSTVLLILSYIRAPQFYRGQMALIFVGVGLIWLGNMLTLLGLTIVPRLDLTPFSNALAALAFGWSLFHYRLLDVMPAAQQQIIHNMRDAVIVLDHEQRVIEANPAAERLLTMPATRAIGQPISALFPAPPDVFQQLDHASETQLELKLDTVAGQHIYDLNLSALRNRVGQVTGRVIVLRDITNLKHLETAARRAAAELEQRNQELDAFSHTIAHDLKAPLSGIIGYTGMLQLFEATTLSAEGQTYVTEITQSARKMEQMITELLQFASLRDVSASLVTVDMQLVAQSALERLRQEISQRGVRVSVAPDLPPALGQPLWLEEVLVNLVSNAVKYIGRDNADPCIRIGCRHTDSGVRYEVQDNGLGISADDQKRLFGMFARFHKGEASGTGLGLSIVVRMIKRLGGQIGVDSEPGRGSVFWFTLPAPPETDTPSAVAV